MESFSQLQIKPDKSRAEKKVVFAAASSNTKNKNDDAFSSLSVSNNFQLTASGPMPNVDAGLGVSCCRFNRFGTLLAMGAIDGRVFFYDFQARTVIKSWNAHVRAVLSLEWSRNGRRLLTSAADGSVAVWSVLETGKGPLPLYRGVCGVGTTVQHATFNPRNDRQILIWQVLGGAIGGGGGLVAKPPLVVCLSPPPSESTVGGGIRRMTELSVQQLTAKEPNDNFDHQKKAGEKGEGSSAGAGKCLEEPVSAAAFDRSGEHIVTGSARGLLTLYNAQSLALVSRHRQNHQQIKAIVVARCSGGEVLVFTNSQDRVIRCFPLADLLIPASAGRKATPVKRTIDGKPREEIIRPQKSFQDAVNRTSWKAMVVSGCGRFLCAASADDTAAVWVWTLEGGGAFVKILTGDKHTTGLHWHPKKPILVSVAVGGLVSLWEKPIEGDWIGFTPEFTEITANTKYIEKEGEFDDFDEDASDVDPNEKSQNGSEKENEEEELLDVGTPADPLTLFSPSTDYTAVYNSSSEDEGGEGGEPPLLFIPPELELEPEEERELAEKLKQPAAMENNNFVVQYPTSGNLAVAGTSTASSRRLPPQLLKQCSDFDAFMNVVKTKPRDEDHRFVVPSLSAAPSSSRSRRHLACSLLSSSSNDKSGMEKTSLLSLKKTVPPGGAPLQLEEQFQELHLLQQQNQGRLTRGKLQQHAKNNDEGGSTTIADDVEVTVSKDPSPSPAPQKQHFLRDRNINNNKVPIWRKTQPAAVEANGGEGKIKNNNNDSMELGDENLPKPAAPLGQTNDGSGSEGGKNDRPDEAKSGEKNLRRSIRHQKKPQEIINERKQK